MRDIDISAVRSKVSPLLAQASALARADLPGCGVSRRGADLLGASLRDAGLRGADLRDGLFLTEPRVNAAKGDAHTRLPVTLVHPAHWGAGQ